MKVAASSSSTCVPSSERRRLRLIGKGALFCKAAVLAALLFHGAPQAQAPASTPGLAPVALPVLAQARDAGSAPAKSPAEVRGTWLTTTANDAIATPARTAQTLQRLREIGLNTVYVEAWKNGYTQFPSQVLLRTLGVAQRPTVALQDPSDRLAGAQPARDLLQETLIEAHRNGLVHIAWFEYGFMAAHASTMNHLRRLKPEWLSRDIQGNEVAPNGFVWMNPLHPQARQFLLDLVLEAVARYDLDGIQFDDRIVWPYVTMGYDHHTRAVYAAEHAGRQPPADARDPVWMRWRADKLNALVQDFVVRIRAAKPGLMLSLSPAVYPWSYEHYLLEWPQWARWPAAARWDEFVPQAYRSSYASFESTWLQQVAALREAGAYRPGDLVAGIRIVGEGADSSWAQLRDSITLARREGQGGHVLWFSRGVLDVYAKELAQFYAASGPAASPRLPSGWRRPALVAQKLPSTGDASASTEWAVPAGPAGRYRVIAHDGLTWRYTQDLRLPGPVLLQLPASIQRVELLVDRRGEAP